MTDSTPDDQDDLTSADLKALVTLVAKALADQPDAVRVNESERRNGTVIELQVAPGDLGRVIGRQGRTAAALRTLLATAAELDDRRATLDIRDASGPAPSFRGSRS